MLPFLMSVFISAPRYRRKNLVETHRSAESRSYLETVVGGNDRSRDAMAPSILYSAVFLAFGEGPHYCLGAALARLEGGLALEIWLGRLPQLALAPGVEIRRQPNFTLRGWTSLPVVFARQRPPGQSRP